MKRNHFLHLGVALSLLFMGIPLDAQTSTQAPTQADVAGTTKLTMQQAIEMALENNLDVVIARLGYQAQGENVGRAKGAYNPLFRADFNNLRSRTPGGSNLFLVR